MKILSVNLAPTPALNLGAIQMDRLGSTVVIAGRNGAGKSRLFRLIQSKAKTLPESLNNSGNRIRQLGFTLKTSKDQAKIDDIKRSLRAIENQHAIDSLSLIYSHDRTPVIVPFVPKKLDLSDPNKYPKETNQKHAQAVEKPGIDHLDMGTFAKIQILQDRDWEANHQNSTIGADIADEAKKQYESFRQLVRTFLVTEITRSVDGDAELFGLPLGKSNLSDGQKVILQLCVAIHAQGASLNELIIFMDEPENHLHPAALLEMIEAVQNHLTEGQMWIATHSVPLLANMPPSSIWWMEENTLKKAGDKPDKVLEGLLGDAERRGKLAAFLDLPFMLASNRFAAECMIPPPTVEHRSGDPQSEQIFDALASLVKPGEALRVLDLGAGKGRLASELAERAGSQRTLPIEYIALDPDGKDAEECRAAILLLSGDPSERYFNDWSSLRAKYDEGSFHVVVMCNVLHEIPPSEWKKLFGTNGSICEMLAADGCLLLVEVQQLPYGEQAHKFGFLVLDTSQIKKLFAIKEEDLSALKIDRRKDDWLKAHLIAKSLLERYSHQTLQDALSDLSKTAREQIEILRRGDAIDYRSGRKHGFWVQQYANAMLAQD